MILTLEKRLNCNKIKIKIVNALKQNLIGRSSTKLIPNHKIITGVLLGTDHKKDVNLKAKLAKLMTQTQLSYAFNLKDQCKVRIKKDYQWRNVKM